MPVRSENLLTVRYRERSKRLDVIFRAAPGLVYTYEDVDPIDYVQILVAESPGSEFNERVRSRPDLHPYRRRRIRHRGGPPRPRPDGGRHG